MGLTQAFLPPFELLLHDPCSRASKSNDMQIGSGQHHFTLKTFTEVPGLYRNGSVVFPDSGSRGLQLAGGISLAE